VATIATILLKINWLNFALFKQICITPSDAPKYTTAHHRHLVKKNLKNVTEQLSCCRDVTVNKYTILLQSTPLVSRTRTNLVDRIFNAAGPRAWNYLPTDLRQPGLWYRQSLKTFLFCQLDQSALWISANEIIFPHQIKEMSKHCNIIRRY